MMATLLPLVYLLGLALWLGAIVFWSFFVTPAAFAVLDRPGVGRLVGVVFPRYYALGAVATLASFAVAFLSARTSGAPAAWGATAALGLDFLLVLASLALRPLVAAASPESAEFRRLHGLSMALNLGMLLLTLAALYLTAREPGLLGHTARSAA